MQVKWLIVEASILMQRKLKQMATYLGADVIGTARNSKEAILIYDTVETDVVVVNLDLLEDVSVESIEDMMRKYPSMKIIPYGAIVEKRQIKMLMEQGIEKVLVKPFTIQQIQEAIKMVLKEKKNDSP